MACIGEDDTCCHGEWFRDVLVGGELKEQGMSIDGGVTRGSNHGTVGWEIPIYGGTNGLKLSAFRSDRFRIGNCRLGLPH